MTDTPEVEETEVTPPFPLPEVRQCQDAANFLYGAAAVKGGEDRWGVMHPVNGGHWATDAEVFGWAVLT
jgi:hypothetical protein